MIIVLAIAKRLQVQERMMVQIVEDIQKNLDTKDVAVCIEAKHLCMVARGVKKLKATTITSKFTGISINNIFPI